MARMPNSRLVSIAVGGVTAMALAIGGFVWWTDRQTYETTDNAFVQADKVPVAALVDGYVAEVLVTDNQAVQAGQVLVRIDPAALKARLAQAEAEARALEAAVRGVDDKAVLEQAMIAQKAAGLQSARAMAQLADAEFNRYGALARQGWVSSQRAQTARAMQSQTCLLYTSPSPRD